MQQTDKTVTEPCKVPWCNRNATKTQRCDIHAEVHEAYATKAVTDSHTVAGNQEAERLADFGLFGTDFNETKAMLRNQLKRHGLRLKVKTNRHSDNVEMWIEKA